MPSYITTNYHEKRSPSDDASDVAKWIIGPSWLGFFFGSALCGGIAGMASYSGFGFVFSALCFGGGLFGSAVLVARALTYDKQPHVTIRETKTEPVVEETENNQPQPIRGNKPPIQPANGLTVEHNGRKYEFTSKQIRLMLDRVSKGDTTLAQNALDFSPGDDYQTAVHIMENLGYWQVKRERGKIAKNRGVVWTAEGMVWLVNNTR